MDLENGTNVYSFAQRDQSGKPAVISAEVIKAYEKTESDRNQKDNDELDKQQVLTMQTENPIITAFCFCMEAKLVADGAYTWHHKDGFGYSGLKLTKAGLEFIQKAKEREKNVE